MFNIEGDNISYQSNIKKEKHKLTQCARFAINTCFHLAKQRCKIISNKNPEEPDYVASLVFNGTQLLENSWNIILKKYNINISLSGIFCHQSPMVEYTIKTKETCELGDLLWCHFHIKKNGDKYQNAVLFQAKKITKFPHYINPKEGTQYNLYNKWPEFKYVRSGILNNKKRKIVPCAPRKGAEYLTIDETSPGLYGIQKAYPCFACMSDDPLVPNQDLGKELADLLDYQSGDMFDSKNNLKSSKGWSKMIWDLLTVTANKTMTRNRSGYSNHPRMELAHYKNQGCINFSNHFDKNIFFDIFNKNEDDYNLLKEWSSQSMPPNDNNNYFEDKNKGISTIIIISKEQE